jgi:hypothetical protein
MKAHRLLTFTAALLLAGLMVFVVSDRKIAMPLDQDMSHSILATVYVTAHSRHG